MPGAITLFPAPESRAGMFGGIVKETLLFPGVFKGDRKLWVIAWLFHLTLALIVVGHIRVFTGVIDGILLSTGLTVADINSLSAAFGGAAGIIIMVTAFLLVIRRLTLNRVREITNPADYLALLLILAVGISGNAMRFGAHFDLSRTRLYFSQLFTFSLAGISVPQDGIFQLHFLLVQLLVIYIPFSKILHFGGIFFTQAAIKKA